MLPSCYPSGAGNSASSRKWLIVDEITSKRTRLCADPKKGQREIAEAEERQRHAVERALKIEREGEIVPAVLFSKRGEL